MREGRTHFWAFQIVLSNSTFCSTCRALSAPRTWRGNGPVGRKHMSDSVHRRHAFLLCGVMF